MMNNYCTNQASKTASYISAGLILVSMCSVDTLAQRKPIACVRDKQPLMLSVDRASSTCTHNEYGVNNNSLTKIESASFEEEVTDFFQKLSAVQEPLGREFEQVLFDNLWDLYQS